MRPRRPFRKTNSSPVLFVFHYLSLVGSWVYCFYIALPTVFASWAMSTERFFPHPVAFDITVFITAPLFHPTCRRFILFSRFLSKYEAFGVVSHYYHTLRSPASGSRYTDHTSDSVFSSQIVTYTTHDVRFYRGAKRTRCTATRRGLVMTPAPSR